MSDENKKRSNAKQSRRQRALRNRMIALVTIGILVVVAVVLLICKFTGVFDKLPVKSMLTLTEQGQIVCEEVSPFESEYYSKSELKTFVKDEISKYNKEHGKDAIKLDTISVKNKKAYVKSTYASAKDYSKFTGITASAGTMKKMKDKFDFNEVFMSVEKGKKTDAVKTVDVTAQGKLKVLVVKENLTVTVPGKICYVSDGATSVIDDHTVAIAQPDGNEDATQLTYIIYK